MTANSCFMADDHTLLIIFQKYFSLTFCFFCHPVLTERARALVVVTAPESVVPWENIRVPH